MVKRLLLNSFQKFIKIESVAGLLLFGATLIALIWANSAYVESYEKLWQFKFGLSFENLELEKPLILWVNDGLMAIFFFLIGLELKRELLIGEINSLKKASLPIFAALGGIIAPVSIFLLLNNEPSTAKAWGVPMATDIAFALAILATLGKRVPLALKIFLTAFAIIDDIAAVLVIAIFYSNHINWELFFLGLLIIAALAFYYNKVKYSLGIGLLAAVIIWFLFLKSGIHPTIAGVLLAFTIPIKRKINLSVFSSEIAQVSNNLAEISTKKEKILSSEKEITALNNLEELAFQVRSPLQSLENKLHNFTAYFILPVFAFANAGVAISTDYNFDFTLMTNIAISLFAGKIIGITLFTVLALKLKLTELPANMSLKNIIGIAGIAGVGFTMSIFIGNLAFASDLVSINSTKVGIIIGSLFSGIIGYIILRISLKKELS